MDRCNCRVCDEAISPKAKKCPFCQAADPTHTKFQIFLGEFITIIGGGLLVLVGGISLIAYMLYLAFSYQPPHG
jgi:hypothetical protein